VAVGSLYEGWAQINARLVERAGALTFQQLQLVGVDGWPLWALLAHVAGARVYWLCGVFDQPGADGTPFADPFAEGWEDRLEVPRRADELVRALSSTWQVVESCLSRWNPEDLMNTAAREHGGEIQLHSRASVLTRLATHDAFHCGEASLLLGINGLPAVDPWTPPASGS
jgi:uncharacterized damage-inducible protein DinB